MKTLLTDILQALGYYSIFYIMAFAASFIILIAEGRKRRLPQLPWLLVIATGFVFFVFGCRIVTLSLDDWKTILDRGTIDHSNGLVLLGGLLFGVPSIFAARRMVNLGENSLDAYAFVLPVGIFLQRIGCFLNGCCYGTIISDGWGVCYTPESSAFREHFLEGVIPATANSSLPVHPVQLYESLGCLIAVVFLIGIRKHIRSDGTLFYLSGLSYFLVRFTTEFFRSAFAHAFKVSSWMHLNTNQWAMMALGGISAFIIFRKEIGPSKFRGHGEIPSFSLPMIIYFLSLSVAFVYASQWLSAPEVFVVNIVLISIGCHFLITLLRSATVPRFRLSFSILLLVSFIMMSQTFPEQAASDTTTISYNTISVGGLLGSKNLMINPVSTTDCDGNTTNIPGRQYMNKYKVAALGFSRTIQTAKDKSFTFGLSAYAGKHDEQATGIPSDRPELFTYAFNPYIQTDSRLLGFGAGLHFGDMTFIPADPGASSFKRYSFYPQLYMRIGHLKYVFGEINFARNFPSSFPSMVFQTSLGVSLNKRSAYTPIVRIGTSSASGVFFSSTVPIGKSLVIEPYIGLAQSFVLKGLNSNYDENSGTVGSVALHYKLNKKSRQ